MVFDQASNSDELSLVRGRLDPFDYEGDFAIVIAVAKTVSAQLARQMKLGSSPVLRGGRSPKIPPMTSKSL